MRNEYRGVEASRERWWRGGGGGERERENFLLENKGDDVEDFGLSNVFPPAPSTSRLSAPSLPSCLFTSLFTLFFAGNLGWELDSE